MKKIVALISCMPVLLFGTLTFDTSHEREVAVLKSFDIDASFLSDPVLTELKKKKRTHNQYLSFFRAMDNGYMFIPKITRILAQSDIPEEFLFLAMAESNFSTKAFSKRRAAGLWQFMPETGKKYGLKVDNYVDERRDLVKSTEAAVRHLTYLHTRFGKWYLAAIAYNCGEGRMNQAIERAGTKDLATLLDPKKKYLPKESRLYIRKIIVKALIGSDEAYLAQSEFNHLLNRANAYPLSTVKLPKGERLSRLARILEMPYSDLRRLNYQLEYDFVPPYSKRYNVYIPSIKLDEFKRNYKPANLRKIYLVHTVKKGDNLIKLEKKYSISYKVIQDFNNLKGSILRLKQKLIIPVQKPSKNSDTDYIVKKGDTLIAIARHFHVKVEKLKQINHMKSDTIFIGRALTVYD